MEKKEDVLKRVLDEKSFENARRAIQRGKEEGSLTYPDLIEDLIKSYKDKTMEAPLEVITTSFIFLKASELIALQEVLKAAISMKIIEEVKDKVNSGKVTGPDTLAALMLASLMKK